MFQPQRNRLPRSDITNHKWPIDRINLLTYMHRSSPKPNSQTFPLYKAVLALPNELLISVLRNLYPPQAFEKYNTFTHRGTEALWEHILRVDWILLQIAHICQRFREAAACVLKELALAIDASLSWKAVIDMHRGWKEVSKFRWGYGLSRGQRQESGDWEHQRWHRS